MGSVIMKDSWLFENPILGHCCGCAAVAASPPSGLGSIRCLHAEEAACLTARWQTTAGWPVVEWQLWEEKKELEYFFACHRWQLREGKLDFNADNRFYFRHRIIFFPSFFFFFLKCIRLYLAKNVTIIPWNRILPNLLIFLYIYKL